MTTSACSFTTTSVEHRSPVLPRMGETRARAAKPRFLHATVWLLLLAVCLAIPHARAGLFSSPEEDAEELEQNKTALQLEIDGIRRVQRVLFPLLKAATALCGSDAAWSYGFGFASRDRFKGDLRRVAPLIGYDKFASVLYVAEASPAMVAGLREGDVVTAIDNRRVDDGSDAYEDAERQIARLAEKGGPVSLAIRRNDELLAFTLEPVKVCNYKLEFIRHSAANAATSGWTLYATNGLLDFTRDDTELASVMSHEIAHSLMSHVKKRFGNALIGTAADLALQVAAGPLGGLFVAAIKPGAQIGARAHSQGFELEADYVGLYIMALAGYRTDSTAMLWRRFAVEYPQFIEGSYWGTHPSSPLRMLLLEETAREINNKIIVGEPLLPQLQSRMASWVKGEEQ
jgi:Zn-dependent protease with chaperone function